MSLKEMLGILLKQPSKITNSECQDILDNLKKYKDIVSSKKYKTMFQILQGNKNTRKMGDSQNTYQNKTSPHHGT